MHLLCSQGIFLPLSHCCPSFFATPAITRSSLVNTSEFIKQDLNRCSYALLGSLLHLGESGFDVVTSLELLWSGYSIRWTRNGLFSARSLLRSAASPTSLIVGSLNSIKTFLEEIINVLDASVNFFLWTRKRGKRWQRQLYYMFVTLKKIVAGSRKVSMTRRLGVASHNRHMAFYTDSCLVGYICTLYSPNYVC